MPKKKKKSSKLEKGLAGLEDALKRVSESIKKSDREIQKIMKKATRGIQ